MKSIFVSVGVSKVGTLGLSSSKSSSHFHEDIEIFGLKAMSHDATNFMGLVAENI